MNLDSNIAESGDRNYLNSPIAAKKFKALRKVYFIRLVLTYILPLVLLVVYFNYQYIDLMTKSREYHILSIAENQTRIFDFYIQERVKNFINIIESSQFVYPIDKNELNSMFDELTKQSDAFIDIGYFDTTTIQSEYSGPLIYLENKDYSREQWFKELVKTDKQFVITDIYPGLRNVPHFTIGAKTIKNGRNYIFKVSLDPQKIYAYMTSLEKSRDINIFIINKAGKLQLAPKDMKATAESFPKFSDKSVGIGILNYDSDNGQRTLAYSWLLSVDWAVIVQEKDSSIDSYFNLKIEIIIASFVILCFLFFIVYFRSKRIVATEKEKYLVRLQLEQASKLATVGELASGIAHEIGNPLNIIANEVGIMQDYANPKFNQKKTLEEMEPHFEKINNAVLRIKDINNKLLTYVRKDEHFLIESDLNQIIDEIISGFIEREMKLDNIKIQRKFANDLPKIKIDVNQFKQVIVNLVNNAKDAIEKGGTITIETKFDGSNFYIAVADTGSGIPEDKINKIFLPFFTTKSVGKGTGLGLSVSLSIIKNFGGNIKVESIVGTGTVFTVVLPKNI